MTLTVSKIKKHFGGIHALDNCSLEIPEGKIIAIIGPNGSGKSTLFHTISRLIQKDSGNVTFKGKNISDLETYQIHKQGIARTFQEVRLFKNLTIKDHIAIALSNEDEKLINNILVHPKGDDKQIKDSLSLVGLEKPGETFATDLSYGQRKLLDLAVAIAKPHTLLMLDEPVAGVNPQLRKQIKTILLKLNKDGETIVLIEHDMNFVMDLADYVYVLDEGKVIAKGKPKDIQNNKKVLNAYLGE
tara:strand:- start:2000 stop:2731 length:732 start_codon:yes stop_codon:yes gene_type:complete